MPRRVGTSRGTFHCTDALHDSLDATMQVERLIEQYGREWAVGMLQAMGTRKGNEEQVKALVAEVKG